jgi:predicted nucleotidyltransferase
VRLVRALEAYVAEIRSTGVVSWIVVNGSFVTGKPGPSDIDLIVVLQPGHDLDAPLGPFEYNAVSRRRVRKRHGFDILVARDGSPELNEYLAFFQQVKQEPDRQKGVLRVDP